MSDDAIYVEFLDRDDGTLLRATRGYEGPLIARLRWHRKLSHAEQVELNSAVRDGALVRRPTPEGSHE